MAATKDELVSAYLDDVDTAVAGWNAYIATYALRYRRAISDYREVWARQDAVDAQRRALVAGTVTLVLSVAGGTALTAMIGKNAGASLVREHASQAARVTGLNRVLRQHNLSLSGEVQEFVAGAVAKEFSRQFNARTTAILTAPPTFGARSSGDDIERFFTEFAAVNDLRYRAGIVAADVRDNDTFDDARAERVIGRLRAAPLMNPPTSAATAAPESLSDRIQLVFLLQDVLKRDYMRMEYHNPRNYRDQGFSPAGRRSITTNPSSRAWGRPIDEVTSSGKMYRGRVAIEDLGDVVKRRLNALMAPLGLGEFATGFRTELDRSELIMAQRALDRLAATMPVYTPGRVRGLR